MQACAYEADRGMVHQIIDGYHPGHWVETHYILEHSAETDHDKHMTLILALESTTP